MNLNDPRVIASSKRLNDSLDALAAAGIPRYSVGKHPDKRGYTIIDRAHRESLGDDIEGVGWVYWPEPRVLPQHTGWYKFRRDAEERVIAMNEGENARRAERLNSQADEVMDAGNEFASPRF